MDSTKFCPGSKGIREATPEDFPCPRCGKIVEIWSDEPRRNCPSCGMLVARDVQNIVACAEWCAGARQCLGEELYERWKATRAN